jgi:tRNA G18 (ribose-2'-O)-methylase SpoU
MKTNVILCLLDMRSVYNVGSIFRTADAVGVSQIYLCGTTPTPTDRFGRARKDLAKVALGAEKNISWEYIKNFGEIIKKMKKDLGSDFDIIALEQDEKSVDYKEVRIKKPTLIVLGNEPSGISKSVLKQINIIAEIPMKGSKESLNVSVAAGIFLYRLLGL